MVAGIGFIDYHTGLEISLSIFYLIPTSFVTWRRGQTPGLVFAASSATVWFIADEILSRQGGNGTVVTYWNTAIRAVSSSVVVVILSELKKAFLRERRQKEDLILANKALEEFSFVASHDLQAPLGKIIAFLDLLQSSPALRQEDRQYIDRIQKSAFRMRRLVSDLLILAKTKLKEENLQPVNLNEVLKDVMSDLEKEIAEAGAQIRADTLPVINAVPNQMYQLFLNLVSNALKYRRKDVSPQVLIQAKEVDGRLEIKVSDNGIGIPEDKVKNIFKPFERSNENDRFEGTGIGLSICEQVALCHKGKIRVESRANSGSTFTVELPSALLPK